MENRGIHPLVTSRLTRGQREEYPVVLKDRMPTSLLRSRHPHVFDALALRNSGKLATKERVHFCGIAIDANNSGVIFTPINFENSAPEMAGQLVMDVLNRFGRETRGLRGEKASETGTTGLIATINEIVEDFIQYGLYKERTRVLTKSHGKPNWVRTIVRSIPLLSLQGLPVYTEFSGTRSIEHRTAVLSRIQAAVLLEILGQFGWWRRDLKNRASDLLNSPVPANPRKDWARLLALAKRDLYQDRALRLVDKLTDYLENSKSFGKGTMLYGVDDFHTVWEHILRKTLSGVEEGWNSRLVKPSLLSKDGDRSFLDGGVTDIVVRHENNLFVLDAKYYAATSTMTFPGWGDIVKQLFYELALKDAAGEKFEVRNGFVFPASIDDGSDFQSIEFETENLELPKIQLIYLSIYKVMQLYVRGEKFCVSGKFKN